MRRLVDVVLGLVVLIAGISALWSYTSEEVRSYRVVLTEVEGEVQILARGGAVAASPGAELSADDRIRTGANSRAVLRIGRDSHVRLGASSSVEVRAVDDDGVQLELEGGALHATVRPEAGAVRIGHRGREIVATHADFSVGARDGVVQVDAHRGEVALTGVDRSRLVAGEHATLVGARAEIGPVPEGVLLEIEWPEPVTTRADRVVLQGHTAPGAVVTLVPAHGPPVEVRARDDGRFVVEVPLTEGANEVRVEAVDLLGRRADAPGRLPDRDTVGPRFRGGVRYGE